MGDNSDWAPNDAAETADTDGDGVGDNADAFPEDATETLDTDGDGVGDNAQAIAEAEAARQKAADEKRRNSIIIGIVAVVVIIAAIAVFLRYKPNKNSKDSVTKDYSQTQTSRSAPVHNQLQILNQWKDEAGYTWRKMSDGSFHYWDGEQWIKHS